MTADYGAKFVKVGDRVEIHPGTDTKVGAVVSVRMDHPQVRNLFKDICASARRHLERP